MARYVVLLRGINVGRAKRVAMADLRALLGDLGYTEVRTHLNSGNVVLNGDDADPAEHESRIEAGIADRLGLDVRCVVLTADELRAIVDAHPLPDIASNGSRMMVHVLAAAPDPALLAEHDSIVLDRRNARLGPRVIYQWCPDGVLAAPPVGGFAEKHLGVAVTARNWNTISRLAEFL
jgi:uncharacterized protein (DUF1697 family)